MSTFILNLYCDYILSMKRGNGVQGKSIAKPLFFLSMIECISMEEININQIKWDHRYLVERYNFLNRDYADNNKSSIIVPYYHLKSSPFYHLIWEKGNRPRMSGNTPSAKYLRENLLYAKLDDELWNLLQDKESRGYLRDKIINNYLTKE